LPNVKPRYRTGWTKADLMYWGSLLLALLFCVVGPILIVLFLANVIDWRDPVVGNVAQAIAAAASAVAAFAALVGVWLARNEVRLSRQQREDEERQRHADAIEFRNSMARAVGVDVEIDGYGNILSSEVARLKVIVQNSGQYPVEEVTVYAATDHLDMEQMLEVESSEIEIENLRTLNPSAVKSVHLHGIDGETIPDFCPVLVAFTDAWEQRWAKYWSGALMAIGSPGELTKV